MTDEQDQVTVTFENRDYVLTRSPGEVILPQYGRKIHHDPACGHLTDSHRLSRLPDPERLLWRRLIDSAPSHDLDGRAEFARSVRLLGGKGQPLTSVCSCVLRPVSPRQAATMRPWPLDEALAAFDRNGRARELDAMKAAARQVNEEFPWEDWPVLPLERYALGQGDSARTRPYCYLLEFGTKALGTIAGGSSAKHLIYRRSRDGSWWHDSRYTDEQEAWRGVRAGIVAAVTAAREGRIADIDTIDAIRSGPSLVAKTLRIYAPDVSLPVYGNDVVRHFLQQLTGEPGPRLERFAMLARLKEVIDADERFRGWPYDLVVLFLYWWSDPFRTQQIVKIAPGGDGSVWGDCCAGGYVAVGWDDVADLRSYADKDEFQAAFSSAYAEKYHGNRSRITSKADELWKLLSLRPGDLVVANRGTSDILGVGRIAGDGYVWREDRAEFRHTVQVEWDESHAADWSNPSGRGRPSPSGTCPPRCGTGSGAPSPHRRPSRTTRCRMPPRPLPPSLWTARCPPSWTRSTGGARRCSTALRAPGRRTPLCASQCAGWGNCRPTCRTWIRTRSRAPSPSGGRSTSSRRRGG
ncbi:hypothetical protein ACIRG8_28340 [Streptomyces sp. NPDC102359]|uniref:hypothetical protein n=1 Tax=Streptomyces sp. NPDC102359 TaxID=3366159 RepID=UPI003824CD8B